MPDEHSYLLAVTVGPVQEFIRAARRTRDLWMGSTILSAVSAAVAREIDGYGELVFPADVPEKADQYDGHVANVVVALVDEPKKAAERAQAAAEKCWTNLAGMALERAERFINRQIWDAQVNDVLEFYAAWYPMTAGYGTARRQAMRLLAARKTCRTFRAASGFEGVPKSSLDGARESVWLGGEDVPADVARALRLSQGEQLDSVGVIKRLALRKPYASVARVAADPWLWGLKDHDCDKLATLCREVGGIAQSDFPGRFAYDGEVVYRGRYTALEKEGQMKGGPSKLKDFVRALEREYGEPYPYLAVLSADGDGMGQILSQIGNKEKHQEFSRGLAKFASDAEKIVGEAQGKLVYSGGDDVLAFVALNHALDCARALHDRFRQIREGVTLSVGISIGHFMDPLEDHLDWAREAEKDAKGHGTNSPRDGLAVHFHPRSGAPLKLRAQWPEKMAEQLEALAGLHERNEIPDKAAYQLRQLSVAYEKWPQETAEDRAALRDAIHADVQRLIGRKERNDKDTGSPLTAVFGRVSNAGDVRLLAEQTILARRFKEAILQAKGEGKSR